jgi:hypothetical protein
MTLTSFRLWPGVKKLFEEACREKPEYTHKKYSAATFELNGSYTVSDLKKLIESTERATALAMSMEILDK